MSRNVADTLVERLTQWGVTRLFGYSGDGINTLLGAVRRAELPFIQARHEESAGFMAVAHSKYGLGQYAFGSSAADDALEARNRPAVAEDTQPEERGVDLGVVAATQGPGAIHLVNALYDAKLDSVPVLAIVGQQNRPALGSDYQQEVDLKALFADVACYREEVTTAVQLVPVLDRAIRSALAHSGPAVVIVPHDVQQQEESLPAGKHAQIPTSNAWRPSVTVPDAEALNRAARLLEDSERIVFLVGQGARHAQEQVRSLAEQLDAAVVTSLLGKPYVDESAPNVAGVMGHLGTTASARVLSECDALLIIGSNDPWTEFYPEPGAARAIQIDISAARVGNRYPVEVALVGDAGSSLEALKIRITRPAADRAPWRDLVEREVLAWRTLCKERARMAVHGVNPEAVVAELSSQLPSAAQIALDVGSCVYWYARQLRLPPDASAQLCSTLASMGGGVPYGVAAKLLDDKRPVVVLSGDGGMQMAGNAELVTIAERWKQWDDPRLVVCVFSNGDLAEVSWEQRETEGDPRFKDSQHLPRSPFANYARMLGLAGRVVTDDSDLAEAWAWALQADRPAVLEVHSDRDMPLLPPLADEQVLAKMRAGLEKEANTQGLDLLNAYVALEESLEGR
ncbi:thiamine pyrophosphate-requiring protein [Glutamicibacter endophyticus]